jgi:hydrogenase-4 component E
VTAAIAFGAKAVLIPFALHRLVRRFNLQRGVDPALGIGASMIAGVALAGFALLVVLPATAGQRALAREDLALALSVVLLGGLMMITRRNLISQVIGLLSLENGLILAAVGVAGMPLVMELSTAALVLMLAVIAGVFALQMGESFQSLDTESLDTHRGEGE